MLSATARWWCSWETVLEKNTWGFRIWRNTSSDRGTALLITPETILARGSGSSYEWVNPDVTPGVTYWYWLEEVMLSDAVQDVGMVTGQLPLTPLPRLFLPLIQREASGDAATPPLDAPEPNRCWRRRSSCRLSTAGRSRTTNARNSRRRQVQPAAVLLMVPRRSTAWGQDLLLGDSKLFMVPHGRRDYRAFWVMA